MGKHFEWTFEEGTGKFSSRRKEESIRAEGRLDGIYVIRTSVVSNIISRDGSKIISAGVRRKSHVDSLPQRPMNGRGERRSRTSGASSKGSGTCTRAPTRLPIPDYSAFPPNP